MNSILHVLSILQGLTLIAGGVLILRLYRTPPLANPRVIHFVRTWKPMSDAEMIAALGSWNETDPRWRAVWDLLQREYEGELAGFSNVTTEALELARTAGRLDMIIQLRRQILTFRGKELRD